MDEDEEEYYDSLDEEQNFDTSRLEIPLDDELQVQDSQNDIFIAPDYVEEEKQVLPKKEHSMSTKIPLYVGEIDKEDIIKKIYPLAPPNKNTSNTCVSCESSLKPKIKIDNTMKKKSENSYWNLYCQKNKLPLLDEKNSQTLRTFYGSTKTFSSLLNSSSCLTGSTWDAPSVFEKYMPKTYATPKSDPLTYDEEDIERSTITTTRMTSVDVDLDNLKSVSQNDLFSKNSKTSKASKSKSNTSNISFRPLSLKFGPDSEKLELLKKQQEYGIRASSRNRARIIQNLTKLKNELHEEKKGVSQ